MRRGVGLLIALCIGGCSLFATSRHPDRAAGARGDPCAPAIVPALDGTAAALVLGLVAYGALANSSPLQSDKHMATGPVLIGGGLAAGVALGLSAIVRATRIGACRAEMVGRSPVVGS
ncbi:MAG: hypothetical protein JNL83_23980 [Myxococcales bacterium]|nr:hypothetical protein [Myxococcales bacterium]